MRFASPGGRIEHISSMPGLRNSVTVNGSPGFTPISAAMRANRAGAILAWATRITSSYDMRTARCRAHLAQQASAGLGAVVGLADRREPLEVEPRIVGVLIGDEPPRALEDHVAGRRRHRRHDGALELGERGRRGMIALIHAARSTCGIRRLRGLEAGPKASEIRFDRLAVGADRRLEHVRRDRQASAAGDDAEHHRVDHGAALLGERLHVDQEVRVRMRPRSP